MENRVSWFIYSSILLLAFFHGYLYATFLPPWGVIDEAHHVDYIHHLAKDRAIPIVGETYLSSKIIESMFATRRWETFHWGPPPSSQDPHNLGFAGHSYEGYHPPLYYILLVPLYNILPDDMLAKLYYLRLGMVGISLATVWMTFHIANELFPQHPRISYFAGVLLALLPARTMSISRVNNDVLLEVIATAFIWVCTRAALKGLSTLRSQLLGLLLGIGTLTKISMIALVVVLPFIFWINRYSSDIRKHFFWVFGIVLVLIIPLVLRNVWLYGDLTGFASFEALNNKLNIFDPPDLTWSSVFLAIWSLLCHFWVVWWKGAQAATNPVIDGFYVTLTILSGLSLIGVTHFIKSEQQSNRRGRVISMYLLAVGSYVVAVLTSYFSGRIPVIQGRFLLPVIVPLSILFIWGLWYISNWKNLPIFSFLVIFIVDALSLFGNLLPYFYYWSAFVSKNASAPHALLRWGERWTLFYQRFLRDKLPGLRPILPWIPLLYLASLALTSVALVKALGTNGDEP
jgi:hypothetical protein